MENPEREWFGTQKVTADQKTENVIGVFDNVADNYDRMNDAMSIGIHRLWKNHLIRMIRPRAQKNDRPMDYLDVAGGTGDIAFRIRERIGQGANITLCDLNENMLCVGRNRAIDRGWVDDFKWVTGNAEKIPLKDNTIDVYTIAFGLRNVTHIDTGLAEAYRVLRPGGRFFCLEFSHIPVPFLSKAYDFYSYNVIPQMGELIAKDRDSYQYLVESIRKFPTQRNLAKRMENAGFKSVKYTNLSAGIVAIHQGIKL